MEKVVFLYPASLALFLLFACQDKAPRLEISQSLMAQKIDSIGQHFIEEGKVRGISVAIVTQDDTLYHKGFGFVDSAGTQPVTPDNIFLMASISKLVGAVLVMKLVEERKLSWDQTLYELLPDFPNQEQARKIKLRHLLSHTSGLQDYSSEIDTTYLQSGIPPTKEDFYNFFRGRELFFAPGTNYAYCNSGFLLMGMIVERITGNEFQHEIDRVINKPTGLHLKLIAENINHPDLSGYFELKDSLLIPRPHWPWIKGDGGLTTTALELAHFPFKWSEGTLIRQASFEEMTQPTVLTDGIVTGYGLGVRNGEFAGERIIGHTGGNHSTYSIMVYFPDRKMTIVVFTNTDNTPSNARRIFGQIALAVLGKAPPDFRNQEITGEDLTPYEGAYTMKDYKVEQKITVRFNREDAHLYYCMEDTTCEKMYYRGNGKFWIAKWPLDFVHFDKDAQGEVRAIKEYYTGYYAVLRKKLSDKR